MKIYYYTFCICLLSLSSFTKLVAQDSEQFNKLFTQWDDSSILQPGVSIAIIKNEEVVFNNSFGYGNLEYQMPLDNKSVFDIASLAKQFTGFAIASLINDQKLDLNESVKKYFPELTFLDEEMQIRHLVYHTSGLRDIGGLFALAYKGENLTSIDAFDIIKNQNALNFPIGTEYDYSNTNYVLLAMVVERISGLSFREWCDKNLFELLKMDNTFANDNPYEIIENRAIAYNENLPNLSFQQNNGMALIGSSAIFSTVDNLIIWIQALKNESVFPEVFKLMKQKGKLDNGNEINYGFGLSFGNYRNEAMIEHTGATPSGFRTAMAIFPDQSLSIVVLSNWGTVNPIRDYAIKIADHYLQDKETAQKELAKSGTDSSTFVLSKTAANRYVGDYLFNGETDLKIRMGEQDDLILEVLGHSGVLIPISETEFELPEANSILHVFNDSIGNLKKVEVWINGEKDGEFVRIEEAPFDKHIYVGDYLFNGEMDVKIRLDDDNNLTAQLEDNNVNPLIPISQTAFDFPALKSKLHFILDSLGSCNKVEVWMNEQKEGELSRIEIDDKAPVNINKYVGLFYSDELKIVFEIGILDDQLFLINSKNGEVLLNNKTEEIFIPEQDIASSLVFEFNNIGETTGFLLNRGSRVRNLKFEKIDQR